MPKNSKPTGSTNKLQIAGVIFIGLSLAGVIELIFYIIFDLALSNPPVNTTGRGVVNIATLGSGGLGILLGLSLLLIGIIKKHR